MRPTLNHGKDVHFTERGHVMHGVVHVGANDGQEIPWYLHTGRVPVLGFEPHPDAYRESCESFAPELRAGSVRLFNVALAARTGVMELHVPRRCTDGVEATQGSSGLPELYLTDEYEIGRTLSVPAWRFDEWAAAAGESVQPYDLLAIDVQGMELQVLEGFGRLLDGFAFLMVELSEAPIYDGEAPAAEVCAWLAERGWSRDSPILSHNDVFFVRDAT